LSERIYRSQVVQLTKEKAALEQRKSDEAKKLARLQTEIGGITRGITKHTSDSARKSKLRQIESKSTEASRVQQRYARYEGEIARKLNSLKTAQENLDRAVAQTQRQQQAAIKKQRSDELTHERELTREQQRRARLFSPTISPHVVEMLPPKLKVLFIAANPKDPSLRLWIDEEVHDIKNKIRQARYGDYVDFASEWAVRTTEVFQALNEHQPNVVHFSGHG
jgi:multidrug efflux pump subunit AcrA (membrane-fusion protein)